MHQKLQTLETQIDSDKRPYKQQGVRKNGQVPVKWIGKTEKYHWIFEFRFLDEKGGNMEIEIDYNDEIIRIEKTDIYGNLYYSKKK